MFKTFVEVSVMSWLYLIQDIIWLAKQCSPKLGCGFVRVLLDTLSHSVDVAQVLLQQARKPSWYHNMFTEEQHKHTENNFWQTLTFAEVPADSFQLNPHNQPPKLVH